MATKRTNRPLREELARLIEARRLRAVARDIGVNDTLLWRVAKEMQTPSGELARQVAVALGHPDDYFPEFRLAFVLQHLGDHPRLRDRLYDQLRRGGAEWTPPAKRGRQGGKR
jgi:hypothetical protein